MNRAEKYLKNGVATEELIGEMETSLCAPYCEVASFWNKQIKPTLTEDERVILKNFKESYKYIGREGTLYIAKQKKDSKFVIQVAIDEYKPDLFQFIKERRRI